MRKPSRVLLLASSLSLLAGCGSGGGGTSSGGAAATRFSLTGPATAGAGVPFALTVTALDATGSVAPGYSGTVHFSSSDSSAVLPQNSTLLNGTGSFSATLVSAGVQTITATDTVSAYLRGSLNLSAVAGEFPVNSFGAKGDGHTDDTAAIQTAINAASAAGGGSVVLSRAIYFTSGQLVVPTGVVLTGEVEGPFEVEGRDPAAVAAGPTVLVTNTGGPFLTLQGIGAGVTDLLFHYPGQVANTAAAPNVYPYTILVTALGTKVARCTVSNAYDFLDIESGRVVAQDLVIGAFHIGVKVDHAYDHVSLRNIYSNVVWDFWGVGFPSPIDSWVENNGIGLEAGRVDGLEITNFHLYVRSIGLLLTDSPDTSQNPTCGYGSGEDFHMEGLTYGIIVTASESPGYKFTNVFAQGQPGLGQSMVKVGAGGSLPPKIEINGGWNGVGALPPPGPDAIFVYIR